MLEVTNGDRAADLLRQALPDAELLPWRDMLHDGPVPPGLGLEALSAVRADFIAAETGLVAAEVRKAFAQRDARLRAALAAGEPVRLWFEHDLYDQLQLVQLLAVLDEAGSAAMLVQAADYLTGLTVETLAAMAGRAEPVTEAQLQLGSLAWSAFRGPTPEAMALLLEEDLSVLPFLAAALERLLAELPAPGDGLTRTERLALRALRARPLTREALFVRQGESETARWLGDLPFYRRLEGLAPLLEATAEGLRLSRLGERVLDGQEDWARLAPPDRWLGGTRLRPQGFWRWDAGRRQLTADAAG